MGSWGRQSMFFNKIPSNKSQIKARKGLVSKQAKS